MGCWAVAAMLGFLVGAELDRAVVTLGDGWSLTALPGILGLVGAALGCLGSFFTEAEGIAQSGSWQGAPAEQKGGKMQHAQAHINSPG